MHIGQNGVALNRSESFDLFLFSGDDDSYHGLVVEAATQFEATLQPDRQTAAMSILGRSTNLSDVSEYAANREGWQALLDRMANGTADTEDIVNLATVAFQSDTPLDIEEGIIVPFSLVDQLGCLFVTLAKVYRESVTKASEIEDAHGRAAKKSDRLDAFLSYAVSEASARDEKLRYLKHYQKNRDNILRLRILLRDDILIDLPEDPLAS